MASVDPWRGSGGSGVQATVVGCEPLLLAGKPASSEAGGRLGLPRRRDGRVAVGVDPVEGRLAGSGDVRHDGAPGAHRAARLDRFGSLSATRSGLPERRAGAVVVD